MTPPEQREQLLQRWNNWADGLVAQGKMRHGHPLEPQGLTISGARGQHIVDGPFAETKEAIGGYFTWRGLIWPRRPRSPGNVPSCNMVWSSSCAPSPAPAIWRIRSAGKR